MPILSHGSLSWSFITLPIIEYKVCCVGRVGGGVCRVLAATLLSVDPPPSSVHTNPCFFDVCLSKDSLDAFTVPWRVYMKTAISFTTYNLPLEIFILIAVSVFTEEFFLNWIFWTQQWTEINISSYNIIYASTAHSKIPKYEWIENYFKPVICSTLLNKSDCLFFN